MEKTPKGKNGNDPQRVLKSIQPAERIVIDITKQSSGTALESILMGVSAFTKCFSDEDKYSVEIKIEKVMESELQESETSQLNNQL